MRSLLLVVLGCGSAAPGSSVANREAPDREAPREPMPTFDVVCDQVGCLKPGRTTVAWRDQHTLVVTIGSPLERDDERYFFAAFQRAHDARNEVTIEGKHLVLMVTMPEPRPPSITLDVQVGACDATYAHCPVDGIKPAHAVITFGSHR